MSECRRIENLVYLFRDGELTADEINVVNEHEKTCSSCREILRELRSFDSELARLREEVPELTRGKEIVGGTVEWISNRTRFRAGEPAREGLLDRVTLWLRPALSSALVLASMLFTAQQFRDSVKVTEMEDRLRSRGSEVTAANSFLDFKSLHLEKLISLGNRENVKPASSAFGAHTVEVLRSGYSKLFNKDPGLFEEFAQEYPNLSKMNLEGNFDEHDRRILATEGRKFLKDFEQLVVQGEK